MKLRDLWQSFIATIKRENPITARFIFWYALVFIVAVMLIVTVQVVPMLRQTSRLNAEIKAGKVYIRGQNPMLQPNVNDFILPKNSKFLLEKFYPLRSPQDSWSKSEILEYWNDSDQKELKSLRLDNQKMLREQLQNLP